MTEPARSLEERTRDTMHRLEHDVDAWVVTADGEGGTPYLVPLSFLWEGATLLVATPGGRPARRDATCWPPAGVVGRATVRLPLRP